MLSLCQASLRTPPSVSILRIMPTHTTLLSFVGNRDPHTEDDEEGPLLSLLSVHSYDSIYLFCNAPTYLERARMVQQIVESQEEVTEFHFVSLELESPIDYGEIYTKFSRTVAGILEQLPADVEISVLLDPGTPQMQTAWFLLAASGALPARLLQGVPPRFAAGAYKVRTVDLSSPAFPTISLRPDVAPVASKMLTSPAWTPEDAVKEIELTSWYAGREAPTILAKSPPFLAVLEQARRVASYPLSVVLLGETGTGKEMIARLIHECSSRNSGPFVCVDCSSILASIAESELFGHKKGAFTGAERDRPGMLRAADGGTVFLDEVGDLSLEIQPKLLRVLEAGLVTPVGTHEEIAVDVRVIAATNHDLSRRVAEGAFRRDLYERLAQAVLEVPPLRERAEDTPVLIRHYLREWNTAYGESKRLPSEIMQFLLDYPLLRCTPSDGCRCMLNGIECQGPWPFRSERAWGAERSERVMHGLG